MKRLALVLMVFCLAFASVYSYPSQKANAIALPVVVPAAVTVGAGAYVVAALALSTVVGVAVGDEYGDEINAHAKKVWASSTQLSKDSLNWTLDSAVGFGNGAITLGTDFVSWMDSYGLPQINDFLLDKLVSSDYGSYLSQLYGFSGDTVATAIGLTVKNTPYEVKFRIKNSDYSEIVVNVQTHENSQYRYLSIGDLYYGTPSKEITDKVLELLRIPTAVTPATIKTILSLVGITATMVALDGTAYVDETLYNNARAKVLENWETMKDAGLVLPVDSVTAYKGDVVMNQSNADGTYTGIDGNIYNPSDLTWSFPVPKVRVGQPNITDGVYVDTPAMTGNPAIDNVLVNNPAIPKTTTNVVTGATTANPDIATTIPNVPGTIPKDPIPEVVGTNPFKNIIPVALALGLFQLLIALIFYLIRMFHFIVTISLIQPTVIQNPYFQWFQTLTILGIKPYVMTINLAIFFLGFSIYKSVRRVFG